MNILSYFHWEGGHDTAAALVVDGQLVAAAEEERFTRSKHDSALPIQAITSCLSIAGMEMKDIDVVAYPDRVFRTGPMSSLATIPSRTYWELCRAGKLRARSLLHHAALRAGLRAGLPWPSRGLEPAVSDDLRTLGEHFGHVPPLQCYDHHEAHAAASFLTSGLARSAIVTVDARGNHCSAGVWRGENRNIRPIRLQPWTNSLGFFYYDCTRYLGLGNSGEGKTMGLAPYGDPVAFGEKVSKLLTVGAPDWYRYQQRPATDVLGFAARNGDTDILAPPYPDFAAAVQDTLERALLHITSVAKAKTASNNLCLGGGVFMNCAGNGRIRSVAAGAPVYVFPNPGDAGLPVGAALLAARDAGEPACDPLDTAYLGPAFSARQIEDALAAEPRVSYCRPADLSTEVAGALASGLVAGWFQGRMEFGPRALGNRSILADPRRVDIRDKVNALKGREAWRPLAPVVLQSEAGKYFELQGESPFMMFAARVRPERSAEVPAVVHVDGSARPQTVRAAQNPPLFRLLEAFRDLTGVPVLLNTSFNQAGEPIVCSPADAIRTFLNTGLDLLVLGDFVARPRKASE